MEIPGLRGLNVTLEAIFNEMRGQSVLITQILEVLGGLPPIDPPPPPPPNLPPLLWDPRLDTLHVYIKPDPTLTFQLTHVWLTLDGNTVDVPDWAKPYMEHTGFTEKGGATHMFGMALRSDGSVVGNKTFRFWWPDMANPPQDQQAGRQPEASGWANLFTPGRYDPALGAGPYCMECIGGVPVCGGGQPYMAPHTSIFAIWQERGQATLPGLPDDILIHPMTIKEKNLWT